MIAETANLATAFEVVKEAGDHNSETAAFIKLPARATSNWIQNDLLGTNGVDRLSNLPSVRKASAVDHFTTFR